MQVCVRQTHQRAEPLRWVSTGDARGVNSDLHHFLHVGGRRLTGVELPARPRLRTAQRPTHVKLTATLTVARRQQEGEEGEEDGAVAGAGHGGRSGRQEVRQEVTEGRRSHFHSIGSLLQVDPLLFIMWLSW